MKVYTRILESRFIALKRSESTLKKIREEVREYSDGGGLDNLQTIQALLRRVESLTKQVRTMKTKDL